MIQDGIYYAYAQGVNKDLGKVIIWLNKGNTTFLTKKNPEINKITLIYSLGTVYPRLLIL